MSPMGRTPLSFIVDLGPEKVVCRCLTEYVLGHSCDLQESLCLWPARKVEYLSIGLKVIEVQLHDLILGLSSD